jgi:hypothetical protein
MQTLDQEDASIAPGSRVPVWWLIAQDGDGRLEPLTVTCGAQRALPVFSFEAEAEMFRRLAGLVSRWRVRSSGCGELVSVLWGPCAQAREVVLDPLPEMVPDGTIELVSLNRGRFVNRLVRLGRTRCY